MPKQAGNSLSFIKTQSASSGYIVLEMAPADILQDWLVLLLKEGAGVTFSLTRDKSKLSVTLLQQGKTDKEYFDNAPAFVSQMEAMLAETDRD